MKNIGESIEILYVIIFEILKKLSKINFFGPIKRENFSPCLIAHTFYAVKWTSELILGLYPANERCRYKVTPSLTGWTQI